MVENDAANDGDAFATARPRILNMNGKHEPALTAVVKVSSPKKKKVQ